jgi:hypothetical protein
MNKMENVRLLEVWSSDCERRNQLRDVQKRIILKRIVGPIAEMYMSCRTTDSHLNRIISTNCCIHTVVPPDDGPRYARNM